jgi:predicted dehydrogenase
MSDPVFRIACLGAGYFSAFHFDGWRRIEQSALVAIADQDISKARIQDVSAHSDLGTMLTHAKADILDIITPPSTHLAAIRDAVKFQLKAIICQKPFCTSLEEAKQAIALAEQAAIPLIIHENFRFQPWFRVIAKALADGKLGRVHQMTFRMRTGDGQGRDAYLARQPYFQKMERFLIHETGVHYIDTFRFLFGKVQSVYADLRKMNPVIAGEDAGHVVFAFDDGVRAIYDADRNLDHLSDNMRRTFGEAMVEGSFGSISLEGDGTVKFRAFNSQEYETLLAPQDWKGFAGDCVYALQDHVVQGLMGKGAFENTAADYLSVVEIEEAIYRSAAEGRNQILPV